MWCTVLVAIGIGHRTLSLGVFGLVWLPSCGPLILVEFLFGLVLGLTPGWFFVGTLGGCPSSIWFFGESCFDILCGLDWFVWNASIFFAYQVHSGLPMGLPGARLGASPAGLGVSSSSSTMALLLCLRFFQWATSGCSLVFRFCPGPLSLTNTRLVLLLHCFWCFALFGVIIFCWV